MLECDVIDVKAIVVKGTNVKIVDVKGDFNDIKGSIMEIFRKCSYFGVTSMSKEWKILDVSKKIGEQVCFKDQRLWSIIFRSFFS